MRSHTPLRLIAMCNVALLVASSATLVERRDDQAASRTSQQAPSVVYPSREASEASRTVADPPPDDVAPMAVPESVQTRWPELLIRPERIVADATLEKARTHAGVAHLAGVNRFEATLTVDARRITVTVAVVDPTAFRPLTPDVTAQTPGVWERLLDGDVMVRHDLLHREALELGHFYELDGPGEPKRLRFGALATSGIPPIADLVVSRETGSELGIDGNNLVIAAVAENVSSKAIGDALNDMVGGGVVEIRPEPATREARIATGGTFEIEPFNYTDLGDGLISIDPLWTRRWIINVDLPHLGRANVHRLIAYQLVEALDQIGDEGLAGHLDRSQFGGVWVPRHIGWDPARPLSMHAWGLAVDLNTVDNCMGCGSQMHPRIVDILEAWGFSWGGRWNPPDPMHFELARYIPAPS